MATLVLRRIGIDTYRENVAYMHRQCPVYRAEGFQALAKIEIQAGEKRILAVLNVVDDEAIVAPGELGLSEQAFAQLAAPSGARARIAQATEGRSVPANLALAEHNAGVAAEIAAAVATVT